MAYVWSCREKHEKKMASKDTRPGGGCVYMGEAYPIQFNKCLCVSYMCCIMCVCVCVRKRACEHSSMIDLKNSENEMPFGYGCVCVGVWVRGIAITRNRFVLA